MGGTRADALERLAAEQFDVVVVGGGIVGAATAALAARHGLSVALLERRDFGSGTSSASSKLIHGGLRYLRMGDVRLVREARRESQLLARVVAPHLVRPAQFLLPVYRGGPYGTIAVRAALAVYTGLTGGRAHLVAPEDARGLVPPLRLGGLRAAVLYDDAQTDDARLCLLNVRGAADHGAVVLNYAAVVALESAGGRVAAARIRDGDGEHVVRGRVFVNATGPWVDELRRLEDPRAGTSVVLSKGAHLVLDPPGEWAAALTVPVDRVRVSFAVPWQGLLLLGTTDSAFDGDPDSVAADDDDERQILREAGSALEGVDASAVRYRFAGLRVLPSAGRSTARARREVTFSRGPLGMLSVAGGKLTTHRRIALAVLEQLRAELGVHGLDAAARPLPGAADPDTVAAALGERGLAPAPALHLARVYGSLASEVVALAGDAPDALEPLAPGAPDVVAQALYAFRSEWARDADDVLRRRTTLARGLDTPALRARVEALA